MSPALIAALATAIPAILVALASFINSLRAKTTANAAANNASAAQSAISQHLTNEHNQYPIQPPHTSAGNQ